LSSILKLELRHCAKGGKYEVELPDTFALSYISHEAYVWKTDKTLYASINAKKTEPTKLSRMRFGQRPQQFT